jgi:hypothetical protein
VGEIHGTLLQQGMTEAPNRNGFVAPGSNRLGAEKKIYPARLEAIPIGEHNSL